jgi:hypothetical protein
MNQYLPFARLVGANICLVNPDLAGISPAQRHALHTSTSAAATIKIND